MSFPQFKASDLTDPTLFHINTAFKQLWDHTESLYDPASSAELLAAITFSHAKSKYTTVPTDDHEFLTLAAARSLFGPGGTATSSSTTVIHTIPSPTSALTILEASAYGASLDDVTLNAAMAALPSVGGAIHIKAGAWTLNSNVAVNKSCILFGDGDATVITRSANMPTNKGCFDITDNSVSIQTLKIDGNVSTPAKLKYATAGAGGFQGTSPETGSTGDIPTAAALVKNSSVWVHGGCNDFSMKGVTITKTAGYAVFCDAQVTSIDGATIDTCNFIDNSPFLFGNNILDLNYGAWAGGIFSVGGTWINGTGSLSYVSNVTVNNCTFYNNSGNQVWSWAPQTVILHQNFTVTGNSFKDIGLDCVNIGAVQNFSVSKNSGYRVGYIGGVPAYLPNYNAVFIDTSGFARSGSYSGNTGININGSGFDTDGLTDSVVSGNTITNSDTSDPLYGVDSVASFGATRGINTNNTYDLRGQKGNSYSGNVFRGMSNISISLFNTRNCLVQGNTVFHPSTATGVPINIANLNFSGTVNTSGTAVTWASGSKFDVQMVDAGYLYVFIAGVRYQISTVASTTSLTLMTSAGSQTGAAYVIGKCQNNTVTANQIYYDGANVCVFEDNSYGAVYGPDYIFNNKCAGSNFGEVLLSATAGNLSSSTIVLSSNDHVLGQPSSVLKRDSSATKIYIQDSTADTQKFQLADSGPTMNVSFGMTGTCNTSGTAVSRVTGTLFTSFQPGADIYINGKAYSVSSITNGNALVLRDSAGSQSGVTYYPLDGSITTGPRGSTTVLDSVSTGHFYSDGWLCMTDSTFCYTNDPGADIFSDSYGLLRYNSTTKRFEQSVTVSSGHRVWAPFGGSSGVAGADTQVQYNAGGSMAADANLTWNYTSRVLTVAGVAATAAVVVTGGYVQANAGFLTASANTDSIQSPNGGVTAKWLIGTVSLTMAGTTTATAGVSDATDFRLISNSADGYKPYMSWAGNPYVPVGVTSAAGSTGYVQYNTGGSFDASANLIWTSASKLLTVTGNSGFAAISAVTGYIQSDGGFLVTNSNTAPTSIYSQNGGITGKWLIGTTSLTLVGTTQAAAGVSDPTNIRMISDSANGYRAYISEAGGVYVPLVGTGVPGGTANQIQYNNGSGGFGASANFTWTAGVLVSTGAQGTFTVDANTIAGHTLISSTGSALDINATGTTADLRLYTTGTIKFRTSAHDPCATISNNGNWGFLATPSVSTGVVVTVGGSVGVAGIAVASGYIQSDGGFYATSGVATSFQTVNIPTGGVYSRSARSLYYTQVGNNFGAPSVTAGDAFQAGALYWDTSVAGLRIYNGAAWVSAGVGGSVTSVSGSGNIIVSPTTGSVIVSTSATPSFTTVTASTGFKSGATAAIDSSGRFIGNGVVMYAGIGATGHNFIYSYSLSYPTYTYFYRAGLSATIVAGGNTYQFEGGILTFVNGSATSSAINVTVF